MTPNSESPSTLQSVLGNSHYWKTAMHVSSSSGHSAAQELGPTLSFSVRFWHWLWNKLCVFFCLLGSSHRSGKTSFKSSLKLS